MTSITTILATIFLCIISLLLVILVLLQNPKDEGGHGVFGVGAVKKMVGTAHVTHFLQKVTYTLTACYFALTFFTAFLMKTDYRQDHPEDAITEQQIRDKKEKEAAKKKAQKEEEERKTKEQEEAKKKKEQEEAKKKKKKKKFIKKPKLPKKKKKKKKK